MKLLVILLCLFSERFLVHGLSHVRFRWLGAYTEKMTTMLPDYAVLKKPLSQWIIVLLPLLLALAAVLYLTDAWLWGLVGFVVNLIVFYYCLGPDNAFYPPAAELLASGNEPASPYLANVNPQLFAPVFWYLLLGPVFLLFYRLNDLLRHYPAYNPYASITAAGIEWLPARITSLCYALAGHFQKGFSPFREHLWTPIGNNAQILQATGLAAIHPDDPDKAVNLPQAEELVEQALMVYLVLLALLSIAVWL
ncbi:MAG: hypothetical protein JJT82_00725 [Legionellaceae bacterium]|nr:hypothetical protein [Legionellaceae bacterium]